MNHDGIPHRRRCQHKKHIEVEVPLPGTAAPAGLLAPDGYAAVIDADKGREMLHPTGQIRASQRCQGLEFCLCEDTGRLRGLTGLRFLPKQAVDPAPVLRKEPFHIAQGETERGPDDQLPVPHLCCQRSTGRADQVIDQIRAAVAGSQTTPGA